MESPNRLKGFICGDLRFGIGECAGDGFRSSLAPLSHFLTPYVRGKGCRRADIRDNEGAHEKKNKKNFDHVSVGQDYGKPILPVFPHVGTPRFGLDKMGEID